MGSDVIVFPVAQTRKQKQDQVDKVLSDDPNYKFIHDLLTAMADIGLPMEGSPSVKAREIYAKYQRENTFDKWARELEAEQAPE